MIKINLIPYRDARRREELTRQSILAATPVVLALLIIAGVHFSLQTRIDDTLQEITTVKSAIKRSKLKLKEIDTFKKQKAMLNKKLDVIATLQKGKLGPVHLLDELASRLPGNLWLTAVKQTGTTLEITGKAFDNIVISNYMRSLEQSPYFTSVDLMKIQTKNKKTSRGVVLKDFILKCATTYRPEQNSGTTR